MTSSRRGYRIDGPDPIRIEVGQMHLLRKIELNFTELGVHVFEVTSQILHEPDILKMAQPILNCQSGKGFPEPERII